MKSLDFAVSPRNSPRLWRLLVRVRELEVEKNGVFIAASHSFPLQALDFEHEERSGGRSGQGVGFAGVGGRLSRDMQSSGLGRPQNAGFGGF